MQTTEKLPRVPRCSICNERPAVEGNSGICGGSCNDGFYTEEEMENTKQEISERLDDSPVELKVGITYVNPYQEKTGTILELQNDTVLYDVHNARTGLYLGRDRRSAEGFRAIYVDI